MLTLRLIALALASTTLFLTNPARASIVGQIGRLPVDQTTSATFRVFGQVDEFCSGTMIGPRLVLTAGHCVYDLETKSPTNPRYFTPGRNPQLSPYGQIAISAIHVDQAYIDGNVDRDVAVLVLKTPVGIQTGWLQIAWDLSILSPHRSVLGGWSGPGTITGYPGDKEKNTMWLVACDFYVAPQIPYRPQYTCDTFGGMSGSSLVVGGPGGKSMIIGVHTTGRGSFNSGSVLTHENKAFVQQVMRLYPL